MKVNEYWYIHGERQQYRAIVSNLAHRFTPAQYCATVWDLSNHLFAETARLPSVAEAVAAAERIVADVD